NPVHADHAFDLLQGAHDRLQLGDVGTIEGEHVDRPPVVAGAAVGFADVDALAAERLPHGGQDAGPIGGGGPEHHRPVDLRLRIPGNFAATLGIGVEGLGTFAPVHGDAAPARDEADDLVAGERIAALGVAHEHVVDAGELDRAARPPRHLAHDGL